MPAATRGTLVVFSKTSDAAIKLLDLPVTNGLAGLKPEQFFSSCALLKLGLGQGVANTSLLSNGHVRERSGVLVQSRLQGQVIASYPKSENLLLFGMLLNPRPFQGKAAAVEVEEG